MTDDYNDDLEELRLSQRLRQAAHNRLMRLPVGHPDEPDPDEQPTKEEDYE